MAWDKYKIKRKADSFFSFVYDRVVNEIAGRVERRFVRMERKLFRRMVSGAMITTGIIFLVISAFFMFREFLDLPNSLSFLIVGGFILLIGVIVRALGGNS